MLTSGYPKYGVTPNEGVNLANFKVKGGFGRELILGIRRIKERKV
jgi:hypothetical protein